jgi:hypothetical protein
LKIPKTKAAYGVQDVVFKYLRFSNIDLIVIALFSLFVVMRGTDETACRPCAQSRLASCCLDCRNECNEEYYMVHDALWLTANPTVNGMLCIGCLEERLGRILTLDDFTDVPINTTTVCGAKSKRLASRLAATRG